MLAVQLICRWKKIYEHPHYSASWRDASWQKQGAHGTTA